MGFKGKIVSDDLSMKATRHFGSASDKARLALEAGCDILLCCNDRKATLDILDNSSDSP